MWSFVVVACVVKVPEVAVRIVRLTNVPDDAPPDGRVRSSAPVPTLRAILVAPMTFRVFAPGDPATGAPLFVIALIPRRNVNQSTGPVWLM
jgi:hypothetical protein